MEVDGKCSFPIRWVLGSMLNFQGCIVWIVFWIQINRLPGLNHMKSLNGKETLDRIHWCPSTRLQAAFTNSWKSFSEYRAAWLQDCMVELLYISYKAFQSYQKRLKTKDVSILSVSPQYFALNWNNLQQQKIQPTSIGEATIHQQTCTPWCGAPNWCGAVAAK